MTHLPEKLAAGLLQRIAGDLAWLRLDRAGVVLDTSGDLAPWGLAGVEAGVSGAERLGFLGDARPGGGTLPLVRLGHGVTVDVHVLPEEDGCWIALTRPPEAAQAADGDAGVAARVADMRVDRLEDHPEALELECAPDGTLTCEARPSLPPWLAGVSLPDPAAIAGAGDFLPWFVGEARGFWAEGTDGELASGPWREKLDGEHELELEACAVRRGARAYLVVAPAGSSYEYKRRVLQAAREQALEHEALRTEIEKKEILLHCVVHDLTNPLTGIMHSLAILEEGGVSAEGVRELATIAGSAAKRQHRMIRNVLHWFASDLAWLEGGGITGSSVDAAACVREVLRGLMPAFARIGVSVVLSSKLDLEQPRLVAGETDRLIRVLENLLDNAMRHTTAGGGVRVAVEQQGGWLVLGVENDGRPVAPELRDRMFEKFARADSGGAAGLGLFYCRMTLEAWGGSIDYQPLEAGSRFVCRLRCV